MRKIVALDLFFSEIPEAMLTQIFPANVTPRTGCALAIPEPVASFDGVLMVMLIHHLVGNAVARCIANVRGAISEAWRVLRPGGRLVIVESCVTPWFYAFERIVYRPASKVIGATLGHPRALQYPPQVLEALIREVSGTVAARQLPLGRWVLQFGVKWPAALTPISTYLFTAAKPNDTIVHPGVSGLA